MFLKRIYANKEKRKISLKKKKNISKKSYNIQRYFIGVRQLHNGLPWWLTSKVSPCQCWRHKLYPWVRNLGTGNGNPLQYSCLGNPMDRGAWRAIQSIHNMSEGRVTYQMVPTVLLTLQNKQWNNLPFKVICLGKVNAAMP